MAHELARLVVDIVLIKMVGKKPHVLLAKRTIDPEKGKWTVPGGHVDEGERFDEAALRELEEETGVKDVVLARLDVFDRPDRDPRYRAISLAYLGVVRDDVEVRGSREATELRWWPLDNLPELGFDHARIIGTAIQLIESQGLEP